MKLKPAAKVCLGKTQLHQRAFLTELIMYVKNEASTCVFCWGVWGSNVLCATLSIRDRGKTSTSPGHGHCVAFLDTGKTTVPDTSVPLFTKAYRWVPMTSIWG